MTTQLLASTLRVSTPLIFAALGGMFAERSGVINIALEGMMLVGSFGAAVGTLVGHSPWFGAACGMTAGLALAAVYGLFVIRLRANQIVAGTAINMLAMGLTPFLCKILYDVTGSTPAIPISERFHSAPLYLSWMLVVMCFLWRKYTPTGLWVSFAGEHPEALDTAGVRVTLVRWIAVLVSGALAGMGGATLSIFLSSSFSRNMTAGEVVVALRAQNVQVASGVLNQPPVPQQGAYQVNVETLGGYLQYKYGTFFPAAYVAALDDACRVHKSDHAAWTYS